MKVKIRRIDHSWGFYQFLYTNPLTFWSRGSLFWPRRLVFHLSFLPIPYPNRGFWTKPDRKFLRRHDPPCSSSNKFNQKLIDWDMWPTFLIDSIHFPPAGSWSSEREIAITFRLISFIKINRYDAEWKQVVTHVPSRVRSRCPQVSSQMRSQDPSPTCLSRCCENKDPPCL